MDARLRKISDIRKRQIPACKKSINHYPVRMVFTICEAIKERKWSDVMSGKTWATPKYFFNFAKGGH